jgi:hypothetical protein
MTFEPQRGAPWSAAAELPPSVGEINVINARAGRRPRSLSEKRERRSRTPRLACGEQGRLAKV